MKNKPIRKRAESPFSKNLKRILADRGISQKVAAELAGVSQSTIVDWTAGSNPTDPLAVQKLCRALKCEFEWLLTGEVSKLEIKGLSLAELFEVQDEPAFSGLFQIEAKRLKRKGKEI